MPERRPCEWLAAPAEDEDYPDDGLELKFRLASEWFAVDSDQLILPVTVLDKTTISVEEPYPALLKQYGGEGLLNDILLAGQDFEEGSTWILMRNERLLTVVPADD